MHYITRAPRPRTRPPPSTSAPLSAHPHQRRTMSEIRTSMARIRVFTAAPGLSPAHASCSRGKSTAALATLCTSCLPALLRASATASLLSKCAGALSSARASLLGGVCRGHVGSRDSSREAPRPLRRGARLWLQEPAASSAKHRRFAVRCSTRVRCATLELASNSLLATASHCSLFQAIERERARAIW
jgi:hypothetical protein